MPQNPQIQQLQMIKKLVGDKNPKDVFYALCKQKGVNPDEILSMLKR